MTSPGDSILDQPAISGSYLFPQARRVRDPFVVRTGEVELACYRRVVDPHRCTIVHFHGNGEAVADYLPGMADELAGLDLNSLFVEYREYGASTGKAQLVAMLGDGQAVIQAAGLDPAQVIVLGRSIGSLYAIELVHRESAVAGLILESGIADATERFLTYADLPAAGAEVADVAAEVRRYFDHQAKLSSYSGPVLLMHTEHDGLIDISHAERNFTWAAGSQKRLLRFSRGDHNSIMAWNREEYFEGIGRLARSIEEARK